MFLPPLLERKRKKKRSSTQSKMIACLICEGPSDQKKNDLLRPGVAAILKSRCTSCEAMMGKADIYSFLVHIDRIVRTQWNARPLRAAAEYHFMIKRPAYAVLESKYDMSREEYDALLNRSCHYCHLKWALPIRQESVCAWCFYIRGEASEEAFQNHVLRIWQATKDLYVEDVKPYTPICQEKQIRFIFDTACRKCKKLRAVCLECDSRCPRCFGYKLKPVEWDPQRSMCRECFNTYRRDRSKRILRPEEGQETLQTCDECNEEKPLQEFPWRTDTGRHRTMCKRCFGVKYTRGISGHSISGHSTPLSDSNSISSE